VHLVTTARILLRPAVYRILFAMGGVEVVELRSAEDGLVLATLVLTDSMLAFVRRLDGVRATEVAEPDAPAGVGARS